MRVTREGGEWKKKKRLFPLMDSIRINLVFFLSFFFTLLLLSRDTFTYGRLECLFESVCRNSTHPLECGITICF